jgi:hypothetical protein
VRVDWAILSRYAESTDGLATIVGAGIDTFQTPTLPAEIAVPLTIQLRGTQEEMTEEHELTVRVLDADLQQLGEDVVLSFQSQLNPEIEAGWEAGAIFTAVNQLLAENEGTYSIEILIDGEHEKSVPFRVLAAA